MIRDHEKREMVVELDGLVGRVAERMPGSTEVRDLTGVVGNLIRMWAELVVALAVILGAAVAHSEMAPSRPAVAGAPALEAPRNPENIANDPVAVERVDAAPVVVAKRHAPDRAPGRPGNKDEVRSVADQQSLRGPCAKRSARMYYGQGVGLLLSESLPVDGATKDPEEVLAVEQFLREGVRLDVDTQ